MQELLVVTKYLHEVVPYPHVEAVILLDLLKRLLIVLAQELYCDT